MSSEHGACATPPSSPGSGFRGSGITILSSAPRLLVTAVSSASTATASLLEGLQKKRTKKKATTGNLVSSVKNHVGTAAMDSEQGERKHVFFWLAV